MTKYTITPWRTQADLLRVRDIFYGGGGEGVLVGEREAVERVMAWKLRGNLPHAVESTALLFDATLHHKIDENSSFSIRAVYSAAFCRFVTGFCDIGRHKERSLEPSSMLEIAKQIGMPAEFVALRHEAIHEELPSLQRLVIAARQALSWLWKVYWSRLEDLETTESERAARTALKDEFKMMLRRFRKSRRDMLRNPSQTLSEQQVEIEQTCDALEKTCKDSRSKTKLLAEALAEDGLLLPGSRELGASLEGAFMIWDGLLFDMSARLRGSFMKSLAVALLETIAKPTTTDPKLDTEKEALSMWLLHILDSGDKRHRETVDIAMETMKLCCLYPGYWTQRIGREALQVNEDIQTEWQQLFDVTSMSAEAGNPLAEVREESLLTSTWGPMAGLEDIDQIQADIDARESADRWRRAIMSSGTPIGMVR